MSEEEIPAPEEESEATNGLVRLSQEEARVLGCLIEKEATTPDYYPLTLNALHSACNQSSNRDPVVDFGTDVVEQAMEDLRYKGLSLLVRQAGARVPKNKHTIESEFPYLGRPEIAIICVLLLRGQQTLGEIRQRTERLYHFDELSEVQSTIEKLIAWDPYSLVEEIPSGGGRRVVTYNHLFCGGEIASPAAATGATSAPAATVVADPTWREEMEEEIASLRTEVGDLRQMIEELKSQLGV